MQKWTPTTVCRAIADEILAGDGFHADKSVCARTDNLRRALHVRQRTESVFDKSANTRMDALYAEVQVELAYPAPSPAEKLYGSFGLWLELRTTIRHREIRRNDERHYPWPTQRPTDSPGDELWRDLSAFGRRILYAFDEPGDLGSFLLVRDKNPVVKDLALGQFELVAYPLRVLKALYIARSARDVNLEEAALAEVAREFKNPRVRLQTLDLARDYQAAGVREFDDLLATTP